MGNLRKSFWNEFLIFLLVICTSVFLLMLYTGFDLSMFSSDDNANQWGPIVEQTFDTIFREGYFPTINFYQYKGFICMDEGVYGVLNPIMFLCYFISKFVLNRALDTISTYVVFCFAFANGFQYLLLRKCRFTIKNSLLTILLLVSSAPFLFYGFWYNIMNIYLMVPILLLSILYMEKGRCSYVMCGMMLAFGLQLGHVQYNFFMYVIYGIISLLLILFYERGLFKKFLTNMGIAISLSIPTLLAMLSANNRRSGINSDFSIFELATKPLEQVIFSVFPKVIIENTPLKYLLYGKAGSSYEQVYVMSLYKTIYTPLFLVGYLCIMIYFFVQIMIYLKKNKNIKLKTIVKYGKENCQQFRKMKNCFPIFFIGTFLSALFFIDYAIGIDGLIANILYYIPLIKSFRFSIKAIFAYIPLLVVPTAYYIQIIVKKYQYKKVKKNFFLGVLVLYAFFGMICNYDTQVNHKNFWMGQEGTLSVFETIDATNEKMEMNQIKKSEYRILSFLSEASKEDCTMSENVLSEELLNTANYSTLTETYSIGGYDVALDGETYKTCDALLANDMNTFARMRGVSSIQWVSLSKEPDFIKKIENQFHANAVKYLIIQKNDIYLEDIVKIIEGMDSIKIKSKKEYDNYNVLIELEGIRPLCGNDLNSSFPLYPDMGRLRAKVDESEEIYFSFMYKDNMQGSLVLDDGSVAAIKLKADVNGQIIAENKTGKAGEMIITYQNSMFDFMIIFAVIISIGTLVCLAELLCFSFRHD